MRAIKTEAQTEREGEREIAGMNGGRVDAFAMWWRRSTLRTAPRVKTEGLSLTALAC